MTSFFFMGSIPGRDGEHEGQWTVLIEAHRRIISLDDLQRIVDGALPAQQKLAWCIDSLIEATRDSGGWHARIFARELLAPSSNLKALFEEDLQPKFAIIRRILSEATGIPQDDPAVLRCMINIAAPCLMLLVAGNGLPGPAQQVLRMPRRALSAHLHRFAFAGLEAIGREHAERAARRTVSTGRRRSATAG